LRSNRNDDEDADEELFTVAQVVQLANNRNCKGLRTETVDES